MHGTTILWARHMFTNHPCAGMARDTNVPELKVFGLTQQGPINITSVRDNHNRSLPMNGKNHNAKNKIIFISTAKKVMYEVRASF
ncbi:hypothetical protein PanWU01x14_026520 [Parasponia andersonii]|uniref:Uncharacterized protein n=1 Tax=Parasponia andersonii TaxID=3476 RepID=A0A2P5DW29_PARAD|nr:hypothetical protein PanWU01x14_026520 [Parasponia andersonii]